MSSFRCWCSNKWSSIALRFSFLQVSTRLLCFSFFCWFFFNSSKKEEQIDFYAERQNETKRELAVCFACCLVRFEWFWLNTPLWSLDFLPTGIGTARVAQIHVSAQSKHQCWDSANYLNLLLYMSHLSVKMRLSFAGTDHWKYGADWYCV